MGRRTCCPALSDSHRCGTPKACACVRTVLLNGNTWERHCVCADGCGSSNLTGSCTCIRPTAVLHLISGFAYVGKNTCKCVCTSLHLRLQGRARVTPATQAWTQQIQQPCTTVRGCTLLAPIATPSPPQSFRSLPGPQHHQHLHNQVSLRMQQNKKLFS